MNSAAFAGGQAKIASSPGKNLYPFWGYLGFNSELYLVGAPYRTGPCVRAAGDRERDRA